METLFISDLHLHEERPDITEGFFGFLKDHAYKADSLYILGDFFEAWVGDDLNSPLIQATKKALKELTTHNTTLFIMHGNRDFLIGDEFCRECNATLINDPTLITLEGRSALLMHGDTLCTDDTDYLRFRGMVRNTSWQTEFLAKPLPERLTIAKQLRDQSKESATHKDKYIMDTNQQEVERILGNYNVDLLIHGHTHRPARHIINTHQVDAERIVLGDWDKLGWYLRVDEEGMALTQFPIK